MPSATTAAGAAAYEPATATAAGAAASAARQPASCVLEQHTAGLDSGAVPVVVSNGQRDAQLRAVQVQSVHRVLAAAIAAGSAATLTRRTTAVAAAAASAQAAARQLQQWHTQRQCVRGLPVVVQQQRHSQLRQVQVSRVR